MSGCPHAIKVDTSTLFAQPHRRATADAQAVLQALAATVTDADNGYNNTNPALDLTNAQVVQTIIYGMKAWVSTTSDTALPSVRACSCSCHTAALAARIQPTCNALQPAKMTVCSEGQHMLSWQCLLQSLANVDSRTIYAVAYATGNINTATTQAGNATDIQKAAYYTQATVRTSAPLHLQPLQPSSQPTRMHRGRTCSQALLQPRVLMRKHAYACTAKTTAGA